MIINDDKVDFGGKRGVYKMSTVERWSYRDAVVYVKHHWY